MAGNPHNPAISPYTHFQEVLTVKTGRGGGRGRKMSMNRPRNVKETTTTKTTVFVISCKLHEQK